MPVCVVSCFSQGFCVVGLSLFGESDTFLLLDAMVQAVQNSNGLSIVPRPSAQFFASQRSGQRFKALLPTPIHSMQCFPSQHNKSPKSRTNSFCWFCYSACVLPLRRKRSCIRNQESLSAGLEKLLSIYKCKMSLCWSFKVAHD